jgi:hypothetical protein
MRRFLSVSGVVAFLALGICAPNVYQVFCLDGFEGLSPLSIMPFLDRTEYAPGYSNRRFLELRAGMTRDEVIGLLGQPLGAYASYEDWRNETWVYSRTARSANYRRRAVEFQKGVVTETVRGIYYD